MDSSADAAAGSTERVIAETIAGIVGFVQFPCIRLNQCQSSEPLTVDARATLAQRHVFCILSCLASHALWVMLPSMRVKTSESESEKVQSLTAILKAPTD